MSIAAMSVVQSPLSTPSGLFGAMKNVAGNDQGVGSLIDAFNKTLFGSSKATMPDAMGIHAIQQLDQTTAIRWDRLPVSKLQGDTDKMGVSGNAQMFEDLDKLGALQRQISQNNVICELTANMAGKVSQGIKQLATGQ